MKIRPSDIYEEERLLGESIYICAKNALEEGKKTDMQEKKRQYLLYGFIVVLFRVKDRLEVAFTPLIKDKTISNSIKDIINNESDRIELLIKLNVMNDEKIEDIINEMSNSLYYSSLLCIIDSIESF